MRLKDVEAGTEIEICELPAGTIKTQLLRLGIIEGAKVKCVYKLPGGTVVISKRHQEIAIGSNVAKKVLVKKI